MNKLTSSFNSEVQVFCFDDTINTMQSKKDGYNAYRGYDEEN